MWEEMVFFSLQLVAVIHVYISVVIPTMLIHGQLAGKAAIVTVILFWCIPVVYQRKEMFTFTSNRWWEL